jgi:hypothetical protein
VAKQRWWERLRAREQQGARYNTVYHPRDYKGRWFFAGYRQAIRDIERTGLQPITDETIDASAKRALNTWVRTG